VQNVMVSCQHYAHSSEDDEAGQCDAAENGSVRAFCFHLSTLAFLLSHLFSPKCTRVTLTDDALKKLFRSCLLCLSPPMPSSVPRKPSTIISSPLLFASLRVLSFLVSQCLDFSPLTRLLLFLALLFFCLFLLLR
jgi:hypothetical protein